MVFFFKQKTAYEMRISDWSSDVCSSDLHTFALILSLMRSVAPFHSAVSAGRWAEVAQFCFFDFPIFNLQGKVLGVIGDGVLGKAVARIGEAFGMEVRFSAYTGVDGMGPPYTPRSEEPTSELQSLMRTS